MRSGIFEPSENGPTYLFSCTHQWGSGWVFKQNKQINPQTLTPSIPRLGRAQCSLPRTSMWYAAALPTEAVPVHFADLRSLHRLEVRGRGSGLPALLPNPRAPNVQMHFPRNPNFNLLNFPEQHMARFAREPQQST